MALNQDAPSVGIIITVCAACHRMRDDHGEYISVEDPLAGHPGALLSHGICPECLRKFYSDYLGGRQVDDRKAPICCDLE